ncbi:peptidyl-prolyl cis-trans isomerase [Neisseria weaveri]|uniref:peptidylprolyl isomerase n=1 Tax=Neisseria weaveri TaxID=28091 RepID=A0A448VKL1_9NEIS|nr:peptidylprolyl isomerase [Neisseria weaveri]EGV38862.1 hypothetical protein l11_03090 [Neisseria weaveri LMG 5135]SAY51351.1 putative peptidyl-prolyl isomerasen [Neisseria weaveri]VEJ50306.1 putative peptidyl-prolyl isomerasen [Neisseria weaveri]
MITRKNRIAVSLLTLAALTAGTVAAKAPEIETARIDSMVSQIMKQADADPHLTQKPDGAAIRKDVLLQLQSFEILKNEALKLGLDKEPDVQNQWKNVEAQFYAQQYSQYLERNTEVDEAEIRAVYDRETRVIRLQQVHFDTKEAAAEAQSLLLKGLSFEELMKRYPNPEQQALNELISPSQLPGNLSGLVAQMSRGQVTAEPVELDGKYYLFKLAASERAADAPPFEQIKYQLTMHAKAQKVQEKIENLLKENGIHPDNPK